MVHPARARSQLQVDNKSRRTDRLPLLLQASAARNVTLPGEANGFMRKFIVGVMGPGLTATPETCEVARELGKRIA